MNLSCIAKIIQEPELVTFESGSVKWRVRVDISRSYKDQDSGEYVAKHAFVDAVAYGKAASAFNEIFASGDHIHIDRSVLDMEEWDRKDGEGKASKLVVRIESAQRVEFPKSRKGDADKPE